MPQRRLMALKYDELMGRYTNRACVKAELANPEYLVEIAFVVAAGERFQA